MVGCVEGILGLRPDLEGLRLAPSIPSQWKEFSLDKVFRGKMLNIQVKNESGGQSGYKEVYLNGEKMEENYIPETMMKDKNEILLVM
jgi:cellobiose phosphorylase